MTPKHTKWQVFIHYKTFIFWKRPKTCSESFYEGVSLDNNLPERTTFEWSREWSSYTSLTVCSNKDCKMIYEKIKYQCDSCNSKAIKYKPEIIWEKSSGTDVRYKLPLNLANNQNTQNLNNRVNILKSKVLRDYNFHH